MVITRRSTYPGVLSESHKSRDASKQRDPQRNRRQVPWCVEPGYVSVRMSLLASVEFIFLLNSVAVVRSGIDVLLALQPYGLIQ